ncbi:hypothetical protein JCM10213_005299 [Rhodosporidiobolus nylandii]
MDRPTSRASTVRPQDGHRAPSNTSERSEFLSLALSRLNLSRPSTPAAASNSLAPLADADEEHSSVDSRTMQTLGSVSSPVDRRNSSRRASSTADPTFFTLSGSYTSGAMRNSETPSLLSVEDASGIVASFLVDSDSFATRSRSEKLLFYQSLVVQFGLCDVENVPTSVTACHKLLRQVHISIKQYLMAVSGGRSIDTVTRYRNVRELREYLTSGSKKSKKNKLVSLDQAKSEMMRPFLINLYP